MSSSSHAPPYEGIWMRRARELDNWTAQHKVVVSATTASLVSTFAGFPLDSLKSRLQSSRESTSLPRLAADVVREEGVGGLWRGFPLPLITISIVRTISFTIYTSTKRILNSDPARARAEAHVQAEAEAKGKSVDAGNWINLGLGLFGNNTARDVALTSLLAGGASGAVVCVGSAPFELVKVRRQLEYQIFRDSHPEHFARAPAGTSVQPFPNTSLPQHPAGTSASIPSSSHGHEAYEHERRPVKPRSWTPSASSAASALAASTTSSTSAQKGRGEAPIFKPPSTTQAVRLIVDKAGWMGLYTGWRLHFIRDTLGTALYFAEYDVMRFYLGRKSGDKRDGQRRGLEEQGELPQWAKGWLPKGLVPFMCGSVAGVTSWALIYPVDAIKTKAQQRALSGLEPRTPLTQLRRLVRGIDPENPKPWLTGIARLYRGLGVSMVRSMLTHGLLWTIVDWANGYIDTKPFERLTTHLA